jgi:putative thioredoxin
MEAKSILEQLLEDSVGYAQAERLIPVADYVSSVDKQENNNVELTVVEAQYRQAARLLAQGKVAPAMDGLLEVLRYNKDYRNGQAKVVMLGIFELLGEEDPLTNAYRREMASVLF